MRIAIIAPGSCGDVQPYVALGKGLQAAGHVVRLVTHQDFESLVSSNGIEFWPMAGKVQDIAESADMRERLAIGNFLKLLSLMAKEAESGALAAAEAGLAACQGADLLLAGLGGLFVALALAEKLALPLVQAFYIPLTQTRAYPSFMLPGIPAGPGGALNRLSYQLARQSIWQAFRPADRRMRKQLLGLPAAPLLGAFDAECTRHTPILYGYSPAVIPPAPDWDARTHVTGYWFPAEQEWQPPEELLRFVEGGAPHARQPKDLDIERQPTRSGDRY